MFYLGVLLVTGSLVGLAFALGIFGASNRLVQTRLSDGATAPKDSEASSLQQSLQTSSDLGIVRFCVLPSMLTKCERKLVLAGRPPAWPLRRVLRAKVLLAGFGVLLTVMVVLGNPGLFPVALGLMAIFIGYVVPDVLLTGRATKRQEEIQRELPDILDQANISIEAGLSFEGALARVAESGDGPLAHEMARTVQDMRLGISRRDAYGALADRTSVVDLQRFTRSIVQAEQFGVSVSTVVRNQAAEMRMKRRYRAEAKALQVPVKMLFPLLTCLLPVLFIVVLAPAAINITKVL